MSSCDWSPVNPRQIHDWLERHPEAVPNTLDDLARFPMAFRRVMVNAVAPDVRLRLWREHLEACIGGGARLTGGQRRFVESTIPRLHQILAAPAPNPVILDWEREMSAEFTGPEAARVFMSIGPEEPPGGLPLPPDITASPPG